MCRLLFNYPLLLILLLLSCKNHVHIGEKEIVKKPAEINELASEIIKETLNDYLKNRDNKALTLPFKNISVLEAVYQQNDYSPVWTNNGNWKPLADSLLYFLNNAKEFSLLPEHYSVTKISDLRLKLTADTASGENKLDASLWAEADLMLTAAFMKMIKDLKAGRLLPDSNALKNDLYLQQLRSFQQGDNLHTIAESLETKNNDYQKLKTALVKFLATADLREYTYINLKDSIHLKSKLRRRLKEEDSIKLKTYLNDSMALANGIRQYQKLKGIKEDGKISAALISYLNQTGHEKFIKIAINMDRCKMLPVEMPSQYIWVNIPGYYLRITEDDSVVMFSKVVVGKPETRTPVLVSAITNMVTYPKWTIPSSIIKKDILPSLKKDPSYISRKGFSLIDRDGREIDPYQVKWAVYQTSIPYKVVQGSGDDNALGVMKFNFNNKYSVYLHDTNQRYLFSKKNRALSHGCVRVENWDGLAYYLLRNDSLAGKSMVTEDSLRSWLEQKQKHTIPVSQRIPLYISYFTCEVKNDKLIFYEDVYGEDRRIKERIFNNKN
jgi:murein L,D-transpeptidase YcbB/YkuD